MLKALRNKCDSTCRSCDSENNYQSV